MSETNQGNNIVLLTLTHIAPTCLSQIPMNILFLYLSIFLSSNPKILQALPMPSKGKNMEQVKEEGRRESERQKSRFSWVAFDPKILLLVYVWTLACSKRSDSGERCTSHRSPLSERLEQASLNFRSCQVLTCDWHFGQFICQTIFHYRQYFLKSRVYYSANFIKTSKIGLIIFIIFLNDSCISSQGFMH